MAGNILDLQQQTPQDSYQRLVQFAENGFYDGAGNPIEVALPTPISENTIELTAGENIHGGVAVYIGSDGQVYEYTSDNIDAREQYLGLAATAALAGGLVNVVPSGIFINQGAGYQSGGTYYASPTAYPSLQPPTTGLVRVLGVGIDNNKIMLKDDQLPYQLT